MTKKIVLQMSEPTAAEIAQVQAEYATGGIVPLLEYRLDVIGPTQYLARCPHCLNWNRWMFGRRNRLGGFILGFTPGSSYRTAVHDAVPHSVERCYYCGRIFSPHAMTLENWEPEGF